MSEFQESATTSGTPRWVGLAVAVLGGISLLGLGVGLSALNQARSIEQSTQATVRQANEALNQRLAKADEINQQLQSDVKVVTDKLKVTHADLVAARKQNKYATVAVDQKVLSHAFACASADRGRALGVHQQAEHRLSEGAEIVRVRHQHAATPVLDLVLDAADVAGDHRPRLPHRLCHGEAKALLDALLDDDGGVALDCIDDRRVLVDVVHRQ